MSTSARKPAPFPSRDEILAFIRESEKQVGKREISRAFGLDADQKMRLKKILKEFEAEGVIGRAGKRRYGEAEALPRVAVIEITGTDTDGELMARPQAWPKESQAPAIYVAPEKRGPAALGPGESLNSAVVNHPDLDLPLREKEGLVWKLAHIYGWEVDFAHDIRPGRAGFFLSLRPIPVKGRMVGRHTIVAKWPEPVASLRALRG